MNVCFLSALSVESDFLFDNLDVLTQRFFVYDNKKFTEIDESRVYSVSSEQTREYYDTLTKSFVFVITYFNNRMSLINTGVGLGRSFIASKLLNLFKDDNTKIINIGFCGSIDPSLKIGDTVLVETVSYIKNTVDNIVDSKSTQEIQFDGIKTGLLSCNNFAHIDDKLRYQDMFMNSENDIRCVDMELYSQASLFANIYSVKVVSDDLTNSNISTIFGDEYFMEKYSKIMQNLLYSL